MLDTYKVTANCNVKMAIQTMEDIRKPVVFIVDEEDKLLGIFTLGDMRKFILKNGDLSAYITEAMNSTPVTFRSLEEAQRAKKEKKMVVYPVVDSNGRLLDALFERDADVFHNVQNNSALAQIPLVIMAGGKGTRLYPYTKVLPKALIPIGNITITERIINSFYNYGCREVYLILNHKANMIKSYFNDLAKDYTIHYIEEKEFLGTGGGLSLLKGVIKGTFILSNCDVLINDDLECIYRTHMLNNNSITFVCAMKNLSIPYGVVNTDSEGKITSLTEKPEFSFLTNTGVYVIEPDILDNIQDGEFIHFPDVAKRCMKKGGKVGVFPVSEKSWLDMGQFSEMEIMMEQLEKRGVD